uniref:Peptidase M28 domain-containing protein n=1 Tax=Arion vulgaris TaxID=1028688 RepID=A0A0B7B9R7_9EUPU
MSSNSSLHLGSENDMFFSSSKRGIGKIRLFIFLLIAIVIGFIVGILVGKFAINDEQQNNEVVVSEEFQHILSDADPSISQQIIDAIDPARIEANLRYLSQIPHIAGRQADFDLVEMLKSRFIDNGLQVQITPYDVLLSYPSNETPNSVRLLDANGTVVYDAKHDESNISQYQDVVPPFNAYSPCRLVEGPLVYAGYGRVEDYIWLKQNNITVTGNIVIVKYGRIFRGDKVDLAAINGAIGIIIYSDPADFTGNFMGDSRVYPETWWMPPSGAQRGTIYIPNGDPLSPGYPANDYGYRFTEESAVPPLPKIPCHPIGYGAALNILKHLGGTAVPTPSDLSGGLNITYRTGPAFLETGMKIQLNVTTKNERAKVENVFGIIKGFVEPDRYVLFGNHRDAWIYGAIDPSSGTAVMMEVARVMGDLVKRGVWRPRRTIVFCSWGAEEYGLVGSTEWVEQYVSTLRERAVAYINVDLAIEGNDTLQALATPLMYNIIHDASKKVKNPNPAEIQAGRPTVYDTWLHFKPWNFTQGDKTVVPLINTPGSGSDYAPLLQQAGITTVDFRYSLDTKLYKMSSYPLYHTEYETFDLVKEQYDKDFEFHAAVARVGGEAIRVLADSLIIPFNVSNYAPGLELCRQSLDRDYGTLLRDNLGSETYDKLSKVIVGFREDVQEFETRQNNIDRKDPYALRELNDKIMLLEKAFLHPEGLPVRPLKKHVIFAENQHDTYAGTSFPGLLDLLFEIEKEPERWETVKQHFHVILTIIQTAGITLRDATSFMSETL